MRRQVRQWTGRIVASALLTIGAASLPSAPAVAQEVRLSKQERAALRPLQAAVQARNVGAAMAALPAAQASAQGGDARFFLASLMLQLGRDTNNRAMQSQAIDAMIASGGVPAAALPQYYGVQANLALDGNDLRKAESALSRMLELAPNNAEALLLLGDVRGRQKRPGDALAMFERAIAIRQASGQRVSESWYKIALKHAFDANLVSQTAKAGRDLVAAYPSPKNWRDAILDYRDLSKPAADVDVDLVRLARSTRALAGERDYQLVAEALNSAGLPIEARAVLDEGVEAKMVDATKVPFGKLRTATTAKATAAKKGLAAAEKSALAAAKGEAALKVGDSHFGAGDYAKAATLYRAALQKGSVDPNLVNTRLGMALGLAGQRAEAEAALRSVTGPRVELANFWLLFLSQRG
jgi:tetratricopeptide (TPR) repeat protein